MAFYVKRSSSRNPAGFAYVGPIASQQQAEKEADAWISAGEVAEVLEATPAVKGIVRFWDKATHADDARELVTYQGEQMTMAAYRLIYEVAA